ncbi:MAG: CoB--CoM heterodisulfide reductase iron-sulfur subunit B family protein [Desulfobacca sp.]|uniref:CoB--CoM heterodisulfide reductase iron-sulfur subunit B family protein n=1 Tax=Desulfobacca sp. TaxID=2067990 RepID=UPI00404AC9A6
MKVSYYPGCSLEVTGKPYHDSTRQVCQALEVQLEEVPGWICCGSSPGLKMNQLLSVALAAFNLAAAANRPQAEVVAPCPFCFRRLLSAQEEIGQDPDLKARVQQAIESDLTRTLTVHNLLGFLHDAIGLPAIAAKIKRPLTGLKVVPYYGCYLVKPHKVTHAEEPEHPMAMDAILRELGAEVLDWDFKTECCGASLSVSKTPQVVALSGRLIREAKWRGAEAVVVVCQLCQANLDMRQGEIERQDRSYYQIPILYFTQLMGLAFGLPYQALGLHHHLVDPLALLHQKRLL